MTDLTLQRGDAGAHGLAALVHALHEMFRATPLGILLATLRASR